MTNICPSAQPEVNVPELLSFLIENEVCSAKRYEDCLKKLRAAPAYQGRERQQFFEDICIYDEIPYLFFTSVAVEFGRKDDK